MQVRAGVAVVPAEEDDDARGEVVGPPEQGERARAAVGHVGALLPQARAAGWDLAAVMRETGCGAQCGLCRPYLRRMLATGETTFHELLWEDSP